MAKYQKYAEYKDSGVEWLGDIPSHWDLQRLKVILNERNEKNDPIKSTNILSLTMHQGVIPYSEKEGSGGNKPKEDLTAYKLVYENDIVLNSMNVIVGSVGISKYFGIASLVYYMLYPRSLNQTNIRFYNYIFQAKSFQENLGRLGTGILIKKSESSGKLNTIRMKISMEDLNNEILTIPSVEEQTQIANFLDHETAQIDTLIAKQEKLIELLKEKRQAVISHAVTKGLNPNVPMKNSGVEWLGEVPEHWKVAPIKRIINLMEQGKSPECENIPATSDQWGVLKTSCVNNGVFHANQNKALPENIKPHTQYQVKAGDVLMSRASGSINLIGSVALVPENVQENLLLSDKIFRIHLSKDCDSRFFTLLLATPYMRTLIERAISGAEGMANNITKTAILEFISAIPPLDEQLQLVVYLNQKIETFNSLIEKSSRAIEVMQERRTALISSAVTGKIDVRHWQSPTVAEAHTELSA